MASIFTRIINREIPGYIIAEDENYIAFLDISPLVLGHTLVVPKKEVDYIFELENEALAGLMVFAKKIAIAVKNAVPCKRIGVSVIGLEVPHTHVHLVPMNSADDVNFTRSKLSPSKEALAEVAEAIKKQL
ncbi:HIT family protein [Ohtaekwangia koreensis]|uniref:Histidine triad (HIT) family protein n=1 Tax=Ohtaekwangia koreensis TaxID=688867 RepID=A0A1T5JML4_9BACT|nr:HIT family protein [Ohtaekwangia koreensis]SKC52614.1 histidine triad (HIT) family protein [Ohtaekwangia koreensis]